MWTLHSNEYLLCIFILATKFIKRSILDECRTLWGEPERVHAGAACVNVHGAVACACACHQNVSLTES